MKENRKRVLSLLLAVVMLVGLFPVSAFADDGIVPVEFVASDGNGGTVIPTVTVYDSNGEVVSQDKGYNHSLAPGSYTFTAEADGYQTVRQSFTVNTVAEGSVQSVSFTMSADAGGEDDGEKEQAEEQQQGSTPSAPESGVQQVSGGIFNARYSVHQVFGVYRSPAYPGGTQDAPNPFTVMDLTAPDFAEADYYYLAPVGPASQAGFAVPGSWNAPAENLDPFVVSLHSVKDGTDTELARGVIGAFSAEGFLFDGNGVSAWFSNSKAYRYSSTAITYTPVAGGRLVCDVSLLTGCAAQSMLEPAEDAPSHVHEWTVKAEGATAVYSCVADGCQYGSSEFTMTLTVPAVVAPGTEVKAAVIRSGGEEWPAELEQDVIYYLGRGETEYVKSTTPPSAEGTYTATVSVGYRYLTSILTADFSIGGVAEPEEPKAEEPPKEEPKPFSQTQVYGGVVVTVNAPAGLLPDDTVVTVAQSELEEAMGYAVAAQRTVDQTKLASSAFEVRITDANGMPVSTADGTPVSISLSLAEPASEGLTTAIYRLQRDWEGYLYAASQPVNDNGAGTVAALPNEELLFVVEVQKVVTMPAQDFEDYTGNLHVIVSAPEGAFPRGTVMVVTPVYDKTVLQTIGDEVGADASRVTAVDITFYSNGVPVEPAVPISVTLKSEVIAKAEAPTVVHMDNEGKTEVMEQTENAKTDEVSFEAESFSVYAVVGGSGDEARMKLVFQRVDSTTTTLSEVYVKNSDTLEALKTIIYDPGVGVLERGLVFLGWKMQETTGTSYTVEDAEAALTIDDIRKWASEQTITETDPIKTVTFTALIYKSLTVTYLDEDGAGYAADNIYLMPSATQAAYTINKPYTPKDDVHNFEGWSIHDDKSKNNFVDPAPADIPDDKVFTNSTDVVLKGDVTFDVVAPKGFWLVFNENGKGASYNAPIFVKDGEKTVQPSGAAPENMSRRGYTFGGWYTDKDCTEGNEFEFGHILEKRTEIYAKWNPVSHAPYTVIFWTQNLARTGYDVKDSLVIPNGQVGENIPYTSVDRDAEDYASGTGFINTDDVYDDPPANKHPGHYKGFNLTAGSKNQTVEITPEGDAVLNLYYDRIEYNFKFYLYRDGTDRNRYDYANNSGNGRNLGDVVTWHSNQSAHPSVNPASGYTIQSETVGGRTYYYFVMEAFYGEDISAKWPKYDQIVGANGREAVSFVMMVGTKLKPNPTSDGDGTVKGIVSTMNENILGQTYNTDNNYVVIRFPDNYNNWRYHIWFETIDGKEYPAETTHTWNGRTYYEETVLTVRSSNTTVTNQNAPKYPGFDFVDWRGQYWNNRNYWTTGNNPTLYHINQVYNRQQDVVTYMDGNYVDGDGKTNQNKGGQEISQSRLIDYGADIPDDVKNYVPSLPEGETGYVFEGWYVDEGCTRPYTWTTMPLGGIVVHAKWRQIQYRVYLHPNAGDSTSDPSLDWGSDSQKLTFRRSYGDSVSLPTGRRNGYEFVGWYRDPGFAASSMFSDEYKLTEEIVTTDYDKTDPANYNDDGMDKWGHGATSNTEIVGGLLKNWICMPDGVKLQKVR